MKDNLLRIFIGVAIIVISSLLLSGASAYIDVKINKAKIDMIYTLLEKIDKKVDRCN